MGSKDVHGDHFPLALFILMTVMLAAAGAVSSKTVSDNYSVEVEYRDGVVRGADNYRVDDNVVVVEKDGLTYTASLPKAVSPLDDPKYELFFAIIFATTLLLLFIILAIRP